MGLQIAPCKVLPASDAEGKSDKNSAPCPVKISSLPPVVDHEPPIMLASSLSYPCTAPASKIALILPHSPASTNDSQTSLSPVSHFSLLLSQCSSLASLPSLGLSFGGPDHMSIKGLKGGVIAVADHCCIRTLSKLGDQVSCVASPADNHFYTASSSPGHAMKMVSSKDPAEYLVSGQANYNAFGRKEGAVRALLVAGDRVFSSHEDLKIRVWARPDTVRSCPSAAAAGGGDHKVVATMPTLWDCMTRSVLPGGYVEVRRHHKKLWIEHVDAISALALDKEEGCLYSASWDRSVKVWRLRDFKCIESFKAHDDAINTLAISPDGFLYTGSADSKIKVWARQSPKKHCLVSTLEAHRSAVNSLALSPDNSLLYSGACDKAIVVWEREDSAQHASPVGALRGHRQAVLCLVSLGDTLCSGSADKTIRVWHRKVGRFHTCIAILEGHASPVKCLSVSPLVDGTNMDTFSLYSGSLDHDIKVWRVHLTTISSSHVADKIIH